MAKPDKKNERNIEYLIYNSIDFLPIWNLYEGVLRTNDLRYLLKLPDYLVLPQYDKDLTEIWNGIIKQIEKVSGIGKFALVKSIETGIKSNILKFNILKSSLIILSSLLDEEEIERINNMGYNFDSRNYEQSLIALKGKLNALGKSIEFKQAMFDKQFKKQESTFDMYVELSSIEQYKKIQINPLTTSVRQFLVYQKELKNYINARRNNK